MVMFITYDDLLSLPSMEEVKVIAGENGLYRGIRWTQVLEFDEIEEWVGKGALVWITGVAFKTWKLPLVKVVEQAIHAQASGVVVCLGPYIREFSQEVLDLCNEKNFPLLQAPKKIKIVEVSYQIAEMIFSSQKRQDKVNLIINDIYMNQVTENTCHLMESIAFCGKWYQCVGIRSADENCDSGMSMINNLLTNYLEKMSCQVMSYEEENRISLILAFENELAVKGHLLENMAEKAEQTMENAGLYITAGNPVEDPHMLGNSMKEAIYTYEIVKHRSERKKVVRYQDLGIHRLLQAQDIKEEKSRFKQDYLGDLLLPQKKELLDTLKCYIRSGQNMKLSAQQMFIHLNTMKYRIHKIEQLLDRSLKDVDVVNNIYIALAILEAEETV
mgnify:CR=1 FL=1